MTSTLKFSDGGMNFMRIIDKRHQILILLYYKCIISHQSADYQHIEKSYRKEEFFESKKKR
jgi:hypothetical protein